MKNIQVIDGTGNCTYAICSISEADFRKIFPNKGQDIEFIDDFIDRVGEKLADEICNKIWKNELNKKKAKGVHGTLFYELDFKKYYPDKKEETIIP